MYWDSIVQVAGSNFTTTSATLVNITGLTFPAVANALYEVEVILKTQSTDTAGMQFSVACSASGSTGEYLLISPTQQGSSSLTFEAQPVGTANGVDKILSAALDETVTAKAVVTTAGNSGSITVQVKKTTSGTATIYIGSAMKIKRLA